MLAHRLHPLKTLPPRALSLRVLHACLSLLLAAVCLFLAASCVDQEDIYADNTPHGNFRALWTILDEHYCYFSYKHETLGLDWNEVYSRYSPLFTDDLTNDQLFELLTSMLAELQDGHVNLYSAADIGRYWGWYEDYPLNLDTELRQSYLSTDYHIASSLRYRLLSDNVAYVLCESFSDALGEGNISAMLQAMASADGLILDIRGNTGGLMSNAELLASHFTNERLLVGYTAYKTGPGHDDFSSPRPQYLDPAEGVRWQKPVIVLTNRECYSAANLFVRDILRCPQASTLGDQTGGGGGMPFSSELPNGWGVRYSAIPYYDADLRQIEFGIEPTVPCQLDSLMATQGYDSLIEAARELLHNPKAE